MFHLRILAFFVLWVITLSLGAPIYQERDFFEGNLIARNNAMKNAVKIARQMKHRLNHFKPGEVLFYSGEKWDREGRNQRASVKPDAVKIGKQNGQLILSQILHKHKIWIPRKAENPHAPRLWKFASKIISQRAKGETSAIVGERRKGSVYDTIEKPALLKNPNVPRLTEHNVVTRKKEIVK